MRVSTFLLLVLFAAPFQALASGLPAAPPESLGFSSDGLKRIDAALQRYVDDGKLAGINLAIARDGKLVYDRSVGMADMARKLPMADDTLVRIYSMSKAVTVVAAMILVEEGRLRLSDPVSRYLPEFASTQVFAGEGPDGIRTVPPNTPMKIFHLMTHTSGLTYPGAYDKTPVGRLYGEKGVFSADRTLAELSKRAAAIPLTDQPGEYHYGASIDVLGRVIEVVSGQPLDVFLRQRVLAPLRMNDTMFTVPDSLQGRFAEIYTTGPDGRLAIMGPAAGQQLYRPDSKLLSGGGGLVSTTRDYLRFCQMLLNGGELDGVRILAPKTVQLMSKGQVALGHRGTMNEHTPGYGMGLGFGVLEDVGVSELPGSAGELRWGGAASTQFFIDPRERIVAVLMTQFMPGDAYPLREDMKALIYQALVDAESVK